MSSNCTYYPILKCKAGERAALKQISTPTDSFVPIFEFVEDQSVDIEEFFEKTKSCYNGKFYFDTINVDDSDRSILKGLISYASLHSIEAFPIMYPEDIKSGFLHWASEKVSSFGFDIPMPEDSLPNSQIIAALLPYTKKVKINLFLDAGIIVTEKNANLITFACKDFIEKKENDLMNFQKITFTACSIPEELSDVESGGTEYFTRYSIGVFERIVQTYKTHSLISKLSYSDCGSAGLSYVKFDPKKMRVLPKIKYTTDEYYIVLKGKKNWTTSTMTKGYKELASEVVNSEYFCGKDFSYGDEKIYEKATDPGSGVGSNQQWVEYTTNHHIAVLVEQLSNLLGA